MYRENRYFGKEIVVQWATCFTRTYLNFNQRTTSPVESVNRQLKTSGITARTPLDTLFSAFFRMESTMQRKYYDSRAQSEQRTGHNVVDKPEFINVRGRVAWQAIELANKQLLKVQKFWTCNSASQRAGPAAHERAREEAANDIESSTITANMGIVSAATLLARKKEMMCRKEHGPILLRVEDFNPF
jgi:hypothetical protein